MAILLPIDTEQMKQDLLSLIGSKDSMIMEYCIKPEIIDTSTHDTPCSIYSQYIDINIRLHKKEFNPNDYTTATK